jgi:pimeloyl-ACP methyl ester carboxylesterase
LIGFSLGGYIATYFSMLYPERVEKLFVISNSPTSLPLDEINAPVLILCDEQDQWIPCEQAYLLQRKIKGSKLVTVPDSGHLVIEENPAALAAEIRLFFQ